MARCGFPLVMVGLAILTALAGSPGTGAEPEKKPADQAKKLGASIDGFRWEFPCKEPMPENPKKGATCASALVKGDPKKTDNFTTEREFEGEKGKRYSVSLRFRGVVEPMMYKDGKKDPKTQRVKKNHYYARHAFPPDHCQ